MMSTRLFRGSLKWIWIRTGNSPQPRRVKWNGGSLTEHSQNRHMKSLPRHTNCPDVTVCSNISHRWPVSGLGRKLMRKRSAVSSELSDQLNTVITYSKMLANFLVANNSTMTPFYYRSPLVLHKRCVFAEFIRESLIFTHKFLWLLMWILPVLSFKRFHQILSHVVTLGSWHSDLWVKQPSAKRAVIWQPQGRAVC